MSSMSMSGDGKLLKRAIPISKAIRRAIGLPEIIDARYRIGTSVNGKGLRVQFKARQANGIESDFDLSVIKNDDGSTLSSYGLVNTTDILSGAPVERNVKLRDLPTLLTARHRISNGEVQPTLTVDSSEPIPTGGEVVITQPIHQAIINIRAL